MARTAKKRKARPSPEDDRVALTYKAGQDTYVALKTLAAKERMTVQALLDEAVATYLSKRLK